MMKKIFFCCFLLNACVGRHTSKPTIWVVGEVRGHSFQVQGHQGWFRQPQEDTTTLHQGDTIYLNYKGHEKAGTLHKWQ
jgi:hypothetical protein